MLNAVYPCLTRCLVLGLWWVIAQATADTPLSFQLPGSTAPWQTSAGIYRTNHVLIRSLWSLRALPAGLQSLSWDELDDAGKTVPVGKYELRVTHHQMQYLGEDSTGPIMPGAPTFTSFK